MPCVTRPEVSRLVFLAGVIIACTFALAPRSVSAEDLQTTDGQTFKNAVIVGQETDRIKVRHSDGLNWISKKVLPQAFASAHHIQIDDKSVQELADEKHLKELIVNFRYQFKEIQTTDARTYPSSEIVALEASALKLQRTGGVERVKLSDLILEQQMALKYDAAKASAAEAETKSMEATLKKKEDDKLFAQTSVRTTLIYAHARVIQRVPDGFICSVWQINPSQANTSLGELSDLGGAVPDRIPRPSEVIQESTQAMYFSPDSRHFVVVSFDMFPVRILVASLPPKVLETKAYRGPLYLVGKYSFDSVSEGSKLIPLAFPTIPEAENYVMTRGLGAYLRDDMTPKEPEEKTSVRNISIGVPMRR